MKLYEVYNGYRGYGPVSVLVTAESEERARELAEVQFQEASINPYSMKPRLAYGPSYWKDLEVEVVFEDCSEENIGEVSDL